MKKISLTILSAFIIVSSFSSCATVFGGKITTAQRTKPLPGQPSRPIRVGAMIADIVLFPAGLIVDFATGAIYRPERNTADATTKSM